MEQLCNIDCLLEEIQQGRENTEHNVKKIRKLCATLYHTNDNWNDVVVGLCDIANKYQSIELHYKLPIMMCLGAVVHSRYDKISPTAIDKAFVSTYALFKTTIIHSKNNDDNNDDDEDEDYWLPLKDVLIRSERHRKILYKDKTFAKKLAEYYYRSPGCTWILRAISIFSGQLTIIYPEAMQGFKITVRDIDSYTTLNTLLSSSLVKNDAMYLNPNKLPDGERRFRLYAWTLIKYIDNYSDFLKKALKYDEYQIEHECMYILPPLFNGEHVIILINALFNWDGYPQLFDELTPTMKIDNFLNCDDVTTILHEMKQNK